MTTETQITAYIDSQPAAKAADLRRLDALVRSILPQGPLWFLDGRNPQGKVVSNPNIGYGQFTMTYADGTNRDFYRIGLSANTGGISVYIMTLPDTTHLATTYAARIGKASVTGYCIKFKALRDVNLTVLEQAIRDGAQGH